MDSVVARAKYTQQVIKEYKHNPLIEALPPIFSKQEVIELLSYFPHFDEAERLLDGQYRIHLIQRIFNIFQVLPLHLDVESRISRMIRQGYLGRNPLSPSYAKSLICGHEDIKNPKKDWKNSSLPTGLTFIGPSGCGKTSTITRILELYPQTIVHSNYSGKDFNFTQLVWLKLECPFDGSVKGLVNSFFLAIDSIYSTKYFEKYGQSNKLSVNTLMPIMTQICNSISLGLLCIDEIQHLNLRGTGSKLMLNFFTTLSNMMGIPLVLIGTPSAMPVLQSQFRQARRGSGQGDLIAQRMEKDEFWVLFLETLFEYQWIQKPVELSQELVDVMYEESQGIIDICLKLYAISQVKAIVKRSETITVSLIKQVAKENFKLVQPMISALKSGNIETIAQYEDIYIPFNEIVEEEKVKLEKNTFLQSMKKNEPTLNKKRLKEEANFRLNILGISKENAQKAINKVYEEMKHTDLNELVKDAFQFAMVATNSTLNEPITNDRSPSDLRSIIEKGKAIGESEYESLKKSGIIKVIEEVI
jgi:energy-coupling factor transporter ATP-binding protein EcfA2